MTKPTSIALLFLAVRSPFVHGFQPSLTPVSRGTPLRMNFFKDIIGKAFENDYSLDKDKTKGQYDGPLDGGDDDDVFNIGSPAIPEQQLTETQQKWRQSQLNGGDGSGTTPTRTALLTGSKWSLDLFLTGIPDRDPSNDLFASKVNISSRDRKVGLMIPDEPTVGGILVQLLEGGKLRVESDSEFINPDELDGAWKLSEDGSMIRICLNVMGYQRTVQTKGSIQKIYWSQEDETSVSTSSAYSIPSGPMYGDASLTSGRQIGTLQWNDGVLQVEKAAGLLGVGSKMVPCGRFFATRMD